MSSFISVISTHPDVLLVYTRERTGGIDLIIEPSLELIESFKWIKEYRAKLDQELAIRENNKAVSSQYNEYQTMLKLVSD